MSDSQRTYTVAIAGLGKRGTHHADALSKNPRFQLVGLCDIDAGRLEAARQTFGVPHGYSDAARMLGDTKPDVFVFCTLPQVRLDLIRAGVTAGTFLAQSERLPEQVWLPRLVPQTLLHAGAIAPACVMGVLMPRLPGGA